MNLVERVTQLESKLADIEKLLFGNYKDEPKKSSLNFWVIRNSTTNRYFQEWCDGKPVFCDKIEDAMVFDEEGAHFEIRANSGLFKNHKCEVMYANNFDLDGAPKKTYTVEKTARGVKIKDEESLYEAEMETFGNINDGYAVLSTNDESYYLHCVIKGKRRLTQNPANAKHFTSLEKADAHLRAMKKNLSKGLKVLWVNNNDD